MTLQQNGRYEITNSSDRTTIPVVVHTDYTPCPCLHTHIANDYYNYLPPYTDEDYNSP